MQDSTTKTLVHDDEIRVVDNTFSQTALVAEGIQDAYDDVSPEAEHHIEDNYGEPEV